jgi:membrane protein required for colicin V production
MVFDAAVYIVLLVAVIAGFHSGFLRSAATIVSYLAAMPLAAVATTLLAPALAARSAAPWASAPVLFVALFLVIGIVLGALARMAISEMVGARIGIPDRLAGSLLGVVRIGLVAVMLVLVFDRLIPSGREPTFLRGSHLRPVLSVAGQMGLKSLPPETTAFIDQLKRERRL